MNEVLDWAAWMLKLVGSSLVVVMIIMLFTDEIQPNYVQGRIIVGLLMLILGYLIDIKCILAGRPLGK